MQESLLNNKHGEVGKMTEEKYTEKDIKTERAHYDKYYEGLSPKTTSPEAIRDARIRCYENLSAFAKAHGIGGPVVEGLEKDLAELKGDVWDEEVEQ
jgi:hypothetical protein